MSPEITKALIKYGVLGPVLIWAFWTNEKLSNLMFDELLLALRNNTAALNAINEKACANLCREASNDH